MKNSQTLHHLGKEDRQENQDKIKDEVAPERISNAAGGMATIRLIHSLEKGGK